MAPVWTNLLPREEPSPSDTTPATPKLDTGAIAGISCAAGALFLGGIGLFLVYWRRQRRLERGVQAYQRPVEKQPFAAQSPPIFTLDYKMDRPPSINGGSISSYSRTPDCAKPDAFSPLGGMVSAMPTHPAYIPRAFVRGSTPAPLSTTPEEVTIQFQPEPEPPLPPSPPQRVRHQSKSRPDDLVMQAYLRAANGERVTSEAIRYASSPEEEQPSSVPGYSSSTLPLRQYQQQQPAAVARGIAVPGLTIPASVLSRPAQQPPLRPSRPYIDTPYLQPHQPVVTNDREIVIGAPRELSPPKHYQPPVLPFRQKYHQHLHQQQQQQEVYEPQYYPPPPPMPPPPPQQQRMVQLGDQPDQEIGRAVTSIHRRENSSDRKIGDWIAAQPDFKEYSTRQPHHRHPQQVPPDSDVW